jgi:hypothetical protein
VPLLPQHFLKAVVNIEEQTPTGDFHTIATGFLLGRPANEGNSVEQTFTISLVTNKHVLINKEMLFLRFDRGSSHARYDMPLIDKGAQIWATHHNPSVDIAVIPILAGKLKEDNVDFSFIKTDWIADSRKIKELGITQGDEVFVLGFPMGLSGKANNYAIVRGGTIARLDEEILTDEHSYLIDCTIFPGNSGGPVFLKPSITSIEGTNPVTNSYLIGVIRAYLPYQDTAYSLSTNPPQPRIVFTENSGLAYAVPLDYALEIIEQKHASQQETTSSELEKSEASNQDKSS